MLDATHEGRLRRGTDADVKVNVIYGWSLDDVESGMLCVQRFISIYLLSFD